jgi:hypothetical protein
MLSTAKRAAFHAAYPSAEAQPVSGAKKPILIGFSEGGRCNIRK